MLRAFSNWNLTSVVRSSSLRLIAVQFYRVLHSCKMEEKSKNSTADACKCADLFPRQYPSQVRGTKGLNIRILNPQQISYCLAHSVACFFHLVSYKRCAFFFA